MLLKIGLVYLLGPAALALASVTNAASSFLDVASAPMQELANRTRTLVLLAVRDGGSMALVRTWRPLGVASIWLEAGNRVPIVGSSTGQSFLAALNEPRFHATTTCDDWAAQRSEGQRQLAQRGFTAVLGPDRFDNEMNAVSRPFNASTLGEPGVFTCGATPDVLSEERMMSEVGPALRHAVNTLENSTGAPRAFENIG